MALREMALLIMIKRIKDNLNKLNRYYRETEENLRYDGNKINNFASIVYCNEDRELNYDLIKRIRKYIAKVTPWFSSFRGDSLNMLSILLSTEDEWQQTFDRINEWEESLRNEGLKESAYLAISSWVLAKCAGDRDKNMVVQRIVMFYSFMHKNYNNITSSADYLVCILLSLTDISTEDYRMILDSALKDAKEKEYTTNNGTQSLVNVLASDVDSYDENMNKTELILKKSKAIGYAIPTHYVSIAAAASMFISDADEFVEQSRQSSEYLEQFEEYTFYMDKSFRYVLAMIVVLGEYNANKIILNAVIAMCISYELDGQAKSLLSTTV